jgi:hypothetical protein
MERYYFNPEKNPWGWILYSEINADEYNNGITKSATGISNVFNVIKTHLLKGGFQCC